MGQQQNNAKQKVIGGLIWSFGERICAQLVTLIVGIILARILSPDDYGIISIVMVLITICDVFVTGGFGATIVQKKEVDKTDYNTAFYISLIMSVMLYLVLFFSAPYFASFYKKDILTNVIRVLGIRLIITALNTIQQAHLQREMKFRKFFIATIFGTVISCGVGIALAYSGYGVWALVGQYLTNSFIDTVVLCFVGGWNPGFKVSRKKAKEIYSFGWKVLCTNLVFTVENSARSLIVGKKFGSEDLAFYDQGRKYPALLVDNVNATIQKVMLPTFSRMQDDRAELKKVLRRSIRVESFILAPLLIGFAAVAQTFVPVVLTDKWSFAIPFVWIFCASYLTRPLESSCHQALLAIGKSGSVFCIMVAINGIDLILMLVSVFVLKSVLWIAVFALISTIVSILCFLIFTNRLISYKVKELIFDIFPSLSLAVMMGGVVFAMNYIPINNVVLLILQILSGMSIYGAASVLFKIEPFIYLKNEFIKKILKRKVLNSDNKGINTNTQKDITEKIIEESDNQDNSTT